MFIYDGMIFIRGNKATKKAKEHVEEWISHLQKKGYYKGCNRQAAKEHAQLSINHEHMSSKKAALKKITKISDEYYDRFYPKIKKHLRAFWAQGHSKRNREKGNAVVLSFYLD